MQSSQRAGNTGEADSHVTHCSYLRLLKQHSVCKVMVFTAVFLGGFRKSRGENGAHESHSDIRVRRLSSVHAP